MTSRLGQWWRDPLVLLCLAAGLLAFVVQSGELGTADTMHRLQTTHWLWTSQPQVFPNEYPEFGLPGRGGKIFSWYGIGQSLLMLPADLVGTWVSHRHIFSEYEDDPAVRSIIVSYSTNILVNVLTVLIAFRLLRQLRLLLLNLAIDQLLVLQQCTILLRQLSQLRLHRLELLLQRFHLRGVFARSRRLRRRGRRRWRSRVRRRGQVACAKRAPEQQRRPNPLVGGHGVGTRFAIHGSVS